MSLRWVVCALLLQAVACGPAPLQPREPTPGKGHFKVVSYNVEKGKHDDESTVAAVGAAQAEILSLQEVTPEWMEVLAERYAERYPYMLFRDKGGAGGLATLSVYPLSDQGIKVGPGGWHPAWHVLVHTPVGPLQILNVHLRSISGGDGNLVTSYLDTDRDHELEIAGFSAECEAQYASLVVGDFNEEPDGAAVRFLERRGFDNALPLYHPGQPTWRHRSVGDQLEATVDHILFDDTLETLNAFVLRRGNSDHLQVVAHFEPDGERLPEPVIAEPLVAP